MKKLFVFCLCFLLLSSNVFADSNFDEVVYTDPYVKENKKSVLRRVEIDNPNEYWYDQWNRAFGPAKGFFAVTGEAVEDAVDWWKNLLGKNTDDEVKQYFEDNTTIDSNNNYSFTEEFNNYITQYSNYFQTSVGAPFIYPCLDVYGKNFKFQGANVNTSLFEQIFSRYKDNYIIVLNLAPSNVSQNYYYNLNNSINILDSIRLYPNSTLPIYNYSADMAGGTQRYMFGRVASEMYYTLDAQLNLISHDIYVGNSSSGAMFLLGFTKLNDLTVGIRPPWANYSYNYSVPICYKESKTIQLYFSNSNIMNNPNGVNVCLDNLYYTNGAPVSRSDELPTLQQMNDYRSYVENITGDTVDSHDIYNYVTNVYPNGNDYQNEPIVNDKPGGLLTSLGDGLGALGTLIGSIIGSIINALVNILLGILQAFTAIVNVFTSSFPSSFRSFMEVFYGLIPEPIMNGIIALFSLTCIMAVIRIIRK